MAEIYTKICVQCGAEYTTEKAKKRLCPDCFASNKKIREASRREPKKKKRKSSGMTIRDVLNIGKVYNAVNRTNKQYGAMVCIIESTNDDLCVCCGATIKPGRMVCPDCVKAAKEADEKWRW